MPLSMYQASVPPILVALQAAHAMLGKAAAHAEAHKFDPAILLTYRLYPGQFAFTRQIQIMSDFAKGGGARLAGVDSPKMPDVEASFPELQSRLDAVSVFLRTLTPAQIDGTEEKIVTIKVAGTAMTFAGQAYLLGFVMPNVYFHFTTAYAILRHNGVEVGKRDYMGALPV